MSLPDIFPPVEHGGQVLVDGGALDNIPADVVRSSGAAIVIAIDVGYAQEEEVDVSMFGLLGRTVDAMMRSSTKAALASADMTIAIDVQGFGSLDWRRADELMTRGYEAAERHSADLLRYRVSEAEWQAWLDAPPGNGVTARGPAAGVPDHRRRPQVRRAIVAHARGAHERAVECTGAGARSRRCPVSTAISRSTGRSRRTPAPTASSCAHATNYAPPFLMLGLTIENTTSEDFRVQLQARYLGSTWPLGLGLRVDAGIGADPTIAAQRCEPIGGSRFFARATAGSNHTFNFVANDRVIAEYRERRTGIQADLGFNLSRQRVAAGFQWGHLVDEVRAGDPGLPELSGEETRASVQWIMDEAGQPGHPVACGSRALVRLTQTFDSPEVAGINRTNRDLTQAQAGISSFFPVGPLYRLFVVGAAGTSFSDKPLPTRQFTVGYPFLLDAFGIGERRGDHYAVITVGALRRVGRLPDFLGGPIFAGLWFENGSAFNSDEKVDIHSQIGGGITIDTLVGPVILGASAGLDGGWRTIFGIGRIFR
jgi:NTE family protein